MGAEIALAVVTLLLGIPASMVATLWFNKLHNFIRMRKEKIKIEGNWAEFVKDSRGRQFSFGKIYYDKRRKVWSFDGTNFRTNGTPFCHWRTVASHLDVENRQFFYIFETTIEGQLDRSYYGFGLVRLAPDAQQQIVPISGHYVSASVDGASMSHSMLRSDAIHYQRDMDGDEVVAFIRAQNRKTRTIAT